ncbi:alpha-ketoglutarate-dependent dioxygenase AlkB family protein [Flavobacterium macacae]|uniref:Alpha-ketoglutarate-dependent dioxygenase AlkB n=1 Tax=Flavobacterium macacae TaxID=2488993 RepID=A0A3P3VZJ3_9FLAO|nr:alpha-ketoglutarate-dependent dioxygenase AlkB [Flavobacterium macacae]RRJ88140.1 alpha-ketoglutarate-dependent dioxygenase AlkB [Flavobacterium macacae]
MLLFEDTELFSSGKSGKTVFDLPDTDLMLFDCFFSKEESDEFYTILLNETNWREYEMPMFDKTVKAPRMISWYEDKENKEENKDLPNWTPELLFIKKRVEKETEVNYNSVLLNLYRNGQDGVSWHSDKVGTKTKNTYIASVTFGETRMFKLRHKFRKDISPLEIPLHHGTLLLMGGTTQSHWEHQVPKTAKDVLPRINLTFRQKNKTI